jgi:hypothetical protein
MDVHASFMKDRQKRKGCGASCKTGQEPFRAAFRFARVPQRRGFIIVGGSLEATPFVLLIVRAMNSEEIAERFQDDPWTSQDLLRISRVSP